MTRKDYFMEFERKRKQSFLLRLPTSIREQATHMAHDEDTSLNHFISIAVAEKISRMGHKSMAARDEAAFAGLSQARRAS